MKIMAIGAALLMLSHAALASEGLVSVQSPYSVKETADRFESIAKNKGLSLFARVNHSENASGVGLTLRPTETIIFGNPKVGTPLMQCAQNLAIDLPQKILVSQDANDKVWLSYNNPSYLKARHEMVGCDELIVKISGVLSSLSKATVAKK